jgi:ABC-type polysaccharide/polyol phosphate export permease
MWPIVSFVQSIFVDDRVPPWSTLTYPSIVAIVLLLLGLATFRGLSGEIVDEL